MATQDGTVAIGRQALQALTSGAKNIAIGYAALKTISSSANNIAIGYNALTNCGDSYSNVAIGMDAGDTITDTGGLNTVIGTEADVSISAAENQIVIGNGTTGVANNSVTLGNDSVTAVYMASDRGATVFSDGAVAGHTAKLDTGQPCHFQSHTTDNDNGFSATSWGTNSAHVAMIHLCHSDSGTIGTHSALDDNDAIGGIHFRGSDGTDFENPSASIICNVDGSPSDNSSPGELLFYTATDADPSVNTIRLTIAAAGTVSGDLNDTSDVGLKENINTIEAGLTIVNQFNPVTFDWKQGSKGSNSGFIAQEIEAILPNDVCGKDYIEPEEGEEAENVGKSINVTGIVAHLVKAVQELSAQVEELKNK